jgi:copper ion binding protein
MASGCCGRPIGERTKTIDIEGMTCEHCVETVKKALENIPGVDDVKVSLEKGNAVVRYSDAAVLLDKLVKAVDDAGYKARAR